MAIEFGLWDFPSRLLPPGISRLDLVSLDNTCLVAPAAAGNYFPFPAH
jgi:hypothetical protein